MKLHVVAPITTPGLSEVDHFTPHARRDNEVSLSILVSGPASIESHFDEAVALPDILRRTVEAEAAGADAVVIDCMGDPGVAAARELTSLLVMGPAQTSMHVAAMLALNFSIVTTGDSVLPIFHDLIRRYGMTDQVCSIRPVDVPVLELQDEGRLRTALFDEALKAVEDDGAHAIVLGCTGMRGWAELLREHLAEHGHPGIPVIDPVITTMKVAEALVDLGLRPSARTYPTPDPRPVLGYDALNGVIGG